MYYLKVRDRQIDLSINKRYIVYIHTLKTTSIKITESFLFICRITCKVGLKQKQVENLKVKLTLAVNIVCNKYNFKSHSTNNKKKSSGLKIRTILKK